MAKPEFGVIGGSGIYDIPGLEFLDSLIIDTPYGQPSDCYRIGRLSGKEVAFLPRHGSGHRIQPQRINYRANIWGFREIGVKKIVSIGASGGINMEMKPGEILLLDQIIDMTSGRESTFYDKDEVVHIDFTDPFCSDLRSCLISASAKSGIRINDRATYVCVNGPRLETAAEIRAYSLLGADVVGMTGMPEAVLSRELELCFAGISVVTNAAAGIKESRLSATEVVEMMKISTEKINKLLDAFFGLNIGESACSCSSTLKNAKM